MYLAGEVDITYFLPFGVVISYGYSWNRPISFIIAPGRTQISFLTICIGR